MDAVADEVALVQVDVSVVDGVDDGDALVGADGGHILRAHFQHGRARGVFDGGADALVALRVVACVDQPASFGFMQKNSRYKKI